MVYKTVLTICLCLYSFYCHALSRNCTKPGLFALTFDDGVTKNYPELLTILDKEKVKATFFIEGQVSADRARLPWLIEVYRRGHELGNHTWTHPHLTRLSKEALASEIEKTDNLIDSVAGYVRKYRLMRPPHGEIDDSVQDYLLKRDNKIVLWNIELTGDWKKGKRKRTREQLWSSFVHAFMKVDPKKDSLILLQHDKSLESIRLVPDVVALVRNLGFKIVSLSECLD